jgi:hypothetical protein
MMVVMHKLKFGPEVRTLSPHEYQALLAKEKTIRSVEKSFGSSEKREKPMQAALTRKEISQRALKAFNACVDTYQKFDGVNRSIAIDKALRSDVGGSLWEMASKLGGDHPPPQPVQAPDRAPYEPAGSLARVQDAIHGGSPAEQEANMRRYLSDVKALVDQGMKPSDAHDKVRKANPLGWTAYLNFKPAPAKLPLDRGPGKYHLGN